VDAFRAEEERKGREFAARVAPWQDFFGGLFTEVFGTVLEHTRTHQEEHMPDQPESATIGGVTYIPMPFELIAGQQAWTLIESDELARTYFTRRTPLNLEEVGRHRHDPKVSAAVLAGPELHKELKATVAEADRELHREFGGLKIVADPYLPQDGSVLAYLVSDAPAEDQAPLTHEDSLARGVSFRADPGLPAGTWQVALKPDGYERPFEHFDFMPELVASLALNGIRAFDLAPDVYEGHAPYLAAAEMMGRLQEIPSSVPSDLSVRALALMAILMDARKPDIARNIRAMTFLREVGRSVLPHSRR